MRDATYMLPRRQMKNLKQGKIGFFALNYDVKNAMPMSHLNRLATNMDTNKGGQLITRKQTID